MIVNNLIGFTTEPADLHSSRFASSIAKRQAIPIFHVNGEDPEAVVRVGQIALEYRNAFESDVVIDVIGYRRHGHSEVDDPTITQPRLYAKIKDHPPLWQIYAKRIGVDASGTVEAIRSELESAHKAASAMQKKPRLRRLPAYWSPYKRGRFDSAYEVDTGVEAARLAEVADKLTSYPADFAIHPKVKKLLDQRAEMGHGKRAVDYGMAEALAFGTLLLSGTPVRFTGQDTRRGTFNQRHAALIDTRTEAQYLPLEHLAPDQARCEIFNSTLSEAGVLGFEYGYSRDYPEALVLWEAQFGDFANGAQVIIDQFISSGEDKWDLPSGVACSCCRTGMRARGRNIRARASSVSCNSPPKTIFKFASPRTPRNIFICCGGRRCGIGASRWSCSHRRACCAIPMRLPRSRIFRARASSGSCPIGKSLPRSAF